MYSPVKEFRNWREFFADARTPLLAEVRELLNVLAVLAQQCDSDDCIYAPGHLRYCDWVKYIFPNGDITSGDRHGVWLPDSIDNLPIESLADLHELLRQRTA